MRGTGVLWGRALGFCGKGAGVLWGRAPGFCGEGRRGFVGAGLCPANGDRGLLAACANASNAAGAPAAPFARQSRSPTSCLKPYERSRPPTSRLKPYERSRSPTSCLKPYERSRSPTSRPKRRGLRALLGGAGVLWELGFARRMETEGLLAACANASNTAGAPAEPFARQSRPPSILTSQFSCGWFCPGTIGKPRGQHP